MTQKEGRELLEELQKRGFITDPEVIETVKKNIEQNLKEEITVYKYAKQKITIAYSWLFNCN